MDTMTIEQTVDIPADHQLFIEVPPEVPAGRAKAAITLSFGDSPALPARAGEKWAYTSSHREEVRAKLEKLRGSLSPDAFGGMGGVAYQRKVREEWDG
jgi:hypothetical protein